MSWRKFLAAAGDLSSLYRQTLSGLPTCASHRMTPEQMSWKNRRLLPVEILSPDNRAAEFLENFPSTPPSGCRTSG